MFIQFAQRLLALVGQTGLVKGRFQRKKPQAFLAENLSRGHQFDLFREASSIPRGEFQPGDVVRLTCGGVIVQGNIADLDGLVRVSSWVRPVLAAEEVLDSLQNRFSRACRLGV